MIQMLAIIGGLVLAVLCVRGLSAFYQDLKKGEPNDSDE